MPSARSNGSPAFGNSSPDRSAVDDRPYRFGKSDSVDAYGLSRSISGCRAEELAEQE